MRKQLHIMIEGVKYVATRVDKQADDTPEAETAGLHRQGGAPPRNEETQMMDPMNEEETDFPYVGAIPTWQKFVHPSVSSSNHAATPGSRLSFAV